MCVCVCVCVRVCVWGGGTAAIYDAGYTYLRSYIQRLHPEP